MAEETSFKFRSRKIDVTRNNLLDEIKHKDLMSEKFEKTCKYLNYVEHLIILVSTITGCVSIFAFASSLCVPVGITSSGVGIKICAITTERKKYKSIIKRKKKRPVEIVLLGKDKLDTIEVLFSKALIHSYVSHDEFVSINNILRKYNEMKKEIKNPETSVKYTI